MRFFPPEGFPYSSMYQVTEEVARLDKTSFGSVCMLWYLAWNTVVQHIAIGKTWWSRVSKLLPTLHLASCRTACVTGPYRDQGPPTTFHATINNPPKWPTVDLLCVTWWVHPATHLMVNDPLFRFCQNMFRLYFFFSTFRGAPKTLFTCFSLCLPF